MNPGMTASPDTIDAQLLDLMLRAGSRWVLWLLLALSLAAVAIMIERVWFFLQERPPRERLAAALRALRDSGAAAALGKLSGARSMEAAVVRACLTHAADGASAIEDHKAAVVETERLRYERRLAFLGTLGNNAPFIGLFGTVLGIIRSFRDLAANMAEASAAVMAGIAEALVATAVGLLVAIPAVIAFNVFKSRVKDSVVDCQMLSRILLSQLKASDLGQREAAE
jgi:biopolymer transport protein ExbB/TolQ